MSFILRNLVLSMGLVLFTSVPSHGWHNELPAGVYNLELELESETLIAAEGFVGGPLLGSSGLSVFLASA